MAHLLTNRAQDFCGSSAKLKHVLGSLTFSANLLCSLLVGYFSCI